MIKGISIGLTFALGLACAGPRPSSTATTTSLVVGSVAVPAAPAGTNWATVKAEFITQLDRGWAKFGTPAPYTYYMAAGPRLIANDYAAKSATLTPGSVNSLSVTLSESTKAGQRYLVYFQADKAPYEWDMTLGENQFHIDFNDVIDGNGSVVMHLGQREWHNGSSNTTVATKVSNQLVVSYWYSPQPISIGYFRVFQDAEYHNVVGTAPIYDSKGVLTTPGTGSVPLYEAFMALEAYPDPLTAPTALWTTYSTELAKFKLL